MDIIEIFIMVGVVACLVLLVVLALRIFFSRSDAEAREQNRSLLAEISQHTRLLEDGLEERFSAQGTRYAEELSRTREELTSTITTTVSGNISSMGGALRAEQISQRDSMEQRFSAQNELLEHRLTSQNTLLGERLGAVSAELRRIQQSNHEDMERLRLSNQESLDRINGTVSEKLQSTLNEQINRSFEQVSRRLNEVNKGLGEMRDVAQGVTDLKKVLSNVKTRGTFGEYQLKAILEEILSPDQYEEQAKVRLRSSLRVDFAIKMPGAGESSEGAEQSFVYLPIDSKFPADSYEHLLDALETGDGESIRAARKNLEAAVKTQGRFISEKYICPPQTTNFALMFFPFEGLYSEVVNTPGLVAHLQEKYRVNVAGPSTMAALLNSLQMGFRTLEIQRKSSEVWKILEDARKEFAQFEKVLQDTRNRLKQADDELDKLVGVRTRAINRALSKVELSQDETEGLPEGA